VCRNVTPREKRIYLIYGFLATVYALLVLRVIVGFFLNVSVSHFGGWGYSIAGGALYLFLRNRIQRWIAAARGIMGDLKERVMVWRLARRQQALGAVAMVGVLFPPFSTKVIAEFVLEPGARAEVRAMVPGAIRNVAVREGEQFPAGVVLATLRNPEIEARAAMVDYELILADNLLWDAQARRDFAAMQKPSQERRRLVAEKAEADWKLQNLALRSPFAGVVTTPRVEQRAGEYLKEGDSFALAVERTEARRECGNKGPLESVLHEPLSPDPRSWR